MNKSDETIKPYYKATGINPQDSKVWNNKGLDLSKLGKYDEAIKAYDKVIGIDPHNSKVLNNKVIYLIQ